MVFIYKDNVLIDNQSVIVLNSSNKIEPDILYDDVFYIYAGGVRGYGGRAAYWRRSVNRPVMRSDFLLYSFIYLYQEPTSFHFLLFPLFPVLLSIFAQ
jgi:hypothetical protein